MTIRTAAADLTLNTSDYTAGRTDEPLYVLTEQTRRFGPSVRFADANRAVAEAALRVTITRNETGARRAGQRYGIRLDGVLVGSLTYLGRKADHECYATGTGQRVDGPLWWVALAEAREAIEAAAAATV